MGEQDAGQRGLQHERTSLAWDRTGVSYLIASALLVRVVGPPYASVRHLPAALGLLLGTALAAGALERRETPDRPAGARPWAMRGVGAATLLLSASSLVAIWAS
jgi:uncharacterized membrane protein YidH (DUF202 family)